MTNDYKIDWKQAQANASHGAWADGVQLTDTGMSVLGKLCVEVIVGGTSVKAKLETRVAYAGQYHADAYRNPAAVAAVKALKDCEAALLAEREEADRADLPG